MVRLLGRVEPGQMMGRGALLGLLVQAFMCQQWDYDA